MTPRISVVIPTRNRRAHLLATLAGLAAQRAGTPPFEVVVVSDGSTDDTAAAVRALAREAAWAGRPLRCVEQAWAGAAAARNAGLRAATAEIILLLDDDVLAGPGLVAAHIARQDAAGGVVALGRIESEFVPGALGRALAVWWEDHYGRLAARAPRFSDFFTANVSFPRAAGLAVGGLDERVAYGEDVEFGYRLAEAGLPFVYAPEAAARTRNPKPGRALLRDFYRQGEGNVLIARKLPGALPRLPLSAYGETNLRMRLARGALLRLAALPGGASLLDALFGRWAESRRSNLARRPLFELARDHYFWRGVRATVPGGAEWARLASPGAPILCYHSVRPGARAARNVYAVEPAQLARQLALLRRLGYRPMPLEALVAVWAAGGLPPPRAVAITFDDGYRDNLTHAWPVLRRFDCPATVFFVTGRAGGVSLWDARPNGGRQPLLTWDDVRWLDRVGFRAGAHTHTHADLTRVAPAEAEAELRLCREALQAQLGRPASLFAYPYGHNTGETQAQVAAAGYQAAFSMRPGLNTLHTPRYDYRRMEIRGTDSLLRFAVKLWTGDDPVRYLPGWSRWERLHARLRGAAR